MINYRGGVCFGEYISSLNRAVSLINYVTSWSKRIKLLFVALGKLSSLQGMEF